MAFSCPFIKGYVAGAVVEGVFLFAGLIWALYAVWQGYNVPQVYKLRNEELGPADSSPPSEGREVRNRGSSPRRSVRAHDTAADNHGIRTHRRRSSVKTRVTPAASQRVTPKKEPTQPNLDPHNATTSFGRKINSVFFGKKHRSKGNCFWDGG